MFVGIVKEKKQCKLKNNYDHTHAFWYTKLNESEKLLLEVTHIM